MSPLWWMFIGYTVIWTAIVLFVGNLQRRQAALAREIAELRGALVAEEAPGVSADTGLPIAPGPS